MYVAVVSHTLQDWFMSVPHVCVTTISTLGQLDQQLGQHLGQRHSRLVHVHPVRLCEPFLLPVWNFDQLPCQYGNSQVASFPFERSTLPVTST